jgi:hypothetical protein
VSIFLKHLGEIAAVQDEQLIQALTTNCAYPPFCHRIGFGCEQFQGLRRRRLGRSWRRICYRDREGGNTGVVPYRLVTKRAGVLSVMPMTIGVGCSTREVDATGAEFGEEQHIQRFHVDGFDDEEIAR